MENALKRQIQQAIAPEFLRQYTNRTTQRLNGPIPELMTNLFRDYGKVTAATFYEQHGRVSRYVYNPANPIADIWNEIDDLHDLSVKAGLTLQETQRISLGWNILNATGHYGKSLIKWDKKDAADKTWENFKDFFSTVYRDNKSVNNITPIQDSSLNQTTADMMAAMTTEITQLKALLLSNHEEEEEHIQSMNAAINVHHLNSRIDNLEMKFTSLEQATHDLIKLLNSQSKQAQDKQNSPSNKRKGENKAGKKYCWTHGWCGHDSKECNNTAKGHKKEATLWNRMGGSDNGVPVSLLNANN